MPTISLEYNNGAREVPDLRERFFGEFEMKTPSDDLYSAVWREDGQNPFHERFGVESVATVTERMTRVVRSEEGTRKDLTGLSTDDATEETWVILIRFRFSKRLCEAGVEIGIDR
ncbi:hypothetical protein BGZ67_007551 [Mortierella alpina]|nr:hypothetical protein BGZ67_007551 [Mortierella alpina]